MTGRSMSKAGTTTRVATARVPGFKVGSGVACGVGLAPADEDGLAETDGDAESDGTADGVALAFATSLGLGSRVSMTGVSLGSGPAVVGSAYDNRPPVSSITPKAVRSAGTTRMRRRSQRSAIR